MHLQLKSTSLSAILAPGTKNSIWPQQSGLLNKNYNIIILIVLKYTHVSYSSYFLFDFQLSLFFDILLCLAEDVTESAFVDGERSGSYGRSTRMGTKCSSKKEMVLMKGARASLWKILRGVKLKGGTDRQTS